MVCGMLVEWGADPTIAIPELGDDTPGSIVRASGSMNGNTLVATMIDIRHQAGGSKMAGGAAKGGGKKKK